MQTYAANMNVYVAEDYNAMSLKAAQIWAAEVQAKPTGNFGLATGSTPIGMYKQLIAMNKGGTLDFSRLTTFNLDEYYPIQKTNDQSYDYFMKDMLFNHVNMNLERAFIPDGSTNDPAAACAYYDKLMAESGGIDLQLLGLGANGHIGFNEPDDHFSSLTTVTNLTQSTIDANKRFFQKEADVPRQALTMGTKSIMMAKKILILVSGSAKADIVKAFICGNITPQVPASILQVHPNVTVVLDKEAAAKL